MTSKEQYCDYKLYLKHRQANSYYNDAVKIKNTQPTVDWVKHCSIALHKSIILNPHNTDSLLILKELLEQNPINPTLTKDLCETYKKNALAELRECYSASDLRKKY